MSAVTVGHVQAAALRLHMRRKLAAVAAPRWNPRPEQSPPLGDWRIWLIMAGRGWGKTRTGAEWTIASARNHSLTNIVGATADDARDIMIEGESGILTCAPPDFRPRYVTSKRRLEWPNGARSLIFTADEPERLRGKQHMRLWCDEVASWRYLEAYDQALFGLRLGRDPRALLTTTPRPIKLIRELLAEDSAGTGRVAVTRGSTYANRDNLAPAFFAQIITRYEGTRLGRQELGGEYLDDTPGALWTRAMCADRRPPPDLARVVVAIDPATTSGEDSDATGIVVAGVGTDERGYVLADRTCRLSPDGWARRAWAAFDEFGADRIVYESNQGGDMVAHTLRTVRPAGPLTAVHASRGKRTRAEPVAALYEQGKVSHVAGLDELEDQLCGWTPESGDSPDRMDAAVWALTALMLGRREFSFFEEDEPMGILDWLTGKDIAARPHQTPLDLTRRAVTIAGYDQHQGVSYGYAGRGYTTASAIRHGTLVSGPGATDAYNEAIYGDHSNSLVNACLFRLATDFSQVPPQVVRHLEPGEVDPVPDHPLTALLRRPNRHMSGLMLRWWTEYVLGIHGNAYWRKIRAGNAETGNVIELWPVSPTRMAPVTYRDSGDFISAYRYWYSASRYEDIPVANVVHHRHGLDDADHRLGCSQLRRVAKQAATDDQVSRWMHNLLANGAQPGLVVNIDKEVSLSSQQRQEFRAYMEEQFGGDNIGGLALVQGGNGIERASLSPADMDLAPLAALSESRICAIFGVPPQVVGAKVGLEHATYSNYDQAAESYTELTLLPLLTTAAETLSNQLLPDFTAERDVELRFDTSGLRALADDENELTTRVVAQWDSGIVTQNEARSKLGYDPRGTEGDVFKTAAVAPELAVTSETAQDEDEDATPPKLRAVRHGRLQARSVPQDRVEALLRASREQRTGQAQGQVETYLSGQRRRVTSKVEAESA